MDIPEIKHWKVAECQSKATGANIHEVMSITNLYTANINLAILYAKKKKPVAAIEDRLNVATRAEKAMDEFLETNDPYTAYKNHLR